MTESQKLYGSSSFKLRFVGYLLLIMSILDFIDILTPFQFMNPVWEFQTIGALVQHSPLLLIALVFIFVGGKNYRHKFEGYLLQFLSLGSLLAGILLILLIPLGITNTWRINHQNNVLITDQGYQQLAQVQQVKEVLTQAKSNQDINQIFKNLNPNGNIPEFKNAQEVRSQLLSQIQQIETNVNNQTRAAQDNNRKKLIKSSVKWNLGALVCASGFIWIWYSARWPRLVKRT
jgi:hypothetical protein